MIGAAFCLFGVRHEFEAACPQSRPLEFGSWIFWDC